MGRDGGGIRIRETSIQLGFTLDGRFQRHTLMVDGRPMPPTPANIKYATRLRGEILDRIRHGTFSLAEYFPASAQGPTQLTVAGQLDTWLAGQRIEESTKAGYESAIRFWNERVGDKPLRSLKTSDILKALASRPLSGKTANNYVSVLRGAVELAVIDRVLTDNPVAAVPRAKHQKEPPDPFTADERERIIAAFAAKHPGQVANLVEAWFWTGMRTSEIFGLRWTSVDLASGYLQVREAVVRGKEKDRTKTHRERRVRLNSRALAALQRQRQFTQLTGDRVFHDPRYSTGWTDERAFRRSYWTPVLKALGIRYRRPYQMRHTYATAMLMVGMNPAFCSRQLGHSVEMFHGTYARWLDGERDDQEMARLEAGIGLELAREDQAST